MSEAARLRRGLSFFFTFEGPVGGHAYLLAGVILMLVKYAIDFTIVKLSSGHSLSPIGFLVPSLGEQMRHVQNDSPGLFALALSGVFFLWIAVALTARRALELRMSPAIAVTLMIPVFNLATMLVLAFTRGSTNGLERPLSPMPQSGRDFPRPQLGRAIMASLVVQVALYALFVISVERFGAALFFFTPFAAGAIAARIAFQRQPRGFWRALKLALWVNLAGAGMLALLGFDGILCITIGMVITTPVTLLGTLVGMLMTEDAPKRHRDFLASLVLLPVFVLNDELRDDSHEYVVLSSIEIAATPQQIWPSLIEFGELEPPDHWIFDLGIAYPIRARIEGHGVGATRYCEFTTGPFVEPIHTWDEPYVLGFDVASQPAPMTETTPWTIHPIHLDGYVSSVRGELRIVPIDGTRSRLEGRTWYQVKMWPPSVFRLLAEFSIHRVHDRVLKHIQTRAERN